MKICVYCKTEHRAETIFCRQCRRPLPSAPRLPRIAFVWLTGAVVLIGFGTFLFFSLSSPAAAQTPEPIATDGMAPNRLREAVTLHTCVADTSHIRRRPGTQAETIGGLLTGTCLTILGRTQDASWVYIASDDQQTGWISATLVTDAGDINKVSVRDDSAMTNTARPTLSSVQVANGAQGYLRQTSATDIPQSLHSRNVVPCITSAGRIGSYITCRIEIAYCDFLPEAEGSPTFCNDRPHPDQAFALVVIDRDWSEYDGQCILVSGYLELDQGILRIQAHDRDQISPCK